MTLDEIPQDIEDKIDRLLEPLREHKELRLLYPGIHQACRFLARYILEERK